MMCIICGVSGRYNMWRFPMAGGNFVTVAFTCTASTPPPRFKVRVLPRQECGKDWWELTGQPVTP